DRDVDLCGFESPASPIQFRGEGRIAVPAHGFSDLAECAATDLLDVACVFRSRCRVALGEAPHGCRLDHDDREGVPEQVVQVTGEPNPLAIDRGQGQLLPGAAQLGGDVDQVVDDEVPETGEEGGQQGRDKL